MIKKIRAQIGENYLAKNMQNCVPYITPPVDFICRCNR